MPAHVELTSPLESELLRQLGQRLLALRKDQSLSSVVLARRVGISRTTLHAVERGEASVAMGTYVRVLSSLGRSADLALLALGRAAG